MNAGLQREAERQRLLLALLHGDASLAGAPGWLRDERAGSARAERGLLAYRANAGASAERALAAAYPTVRLLLGDANFAALARALWHAQPPQRGDLAMFGDALPAFLAASPQLADEPYLADCARLDWALHCADQADDGADAPAGLQHLADTDPSALQIDLRPGTVLLASSWPVATIWHAHRATDPDRFAAVRSALAGGRGERALVWRHGWRGQVQALADTDARFVRALLDGQSLAQAIDGAGAGFDFEAWLLQALACGWLAAVRPVASA
jgi:hypothetical protein